MSSEGPKFPGTTANLSEASTLENKDAWGTPGNVAADDATESTIVAATFDTPDISQILVASNFGFSAVSGTVDGITVEIDRRSIIASSGKDFRVQLATGTVFANLVGTNKAVPATIWPTTSAVATYGGAADTWSASLTAAQVTAAGFAVFVSCQANIANADVGMDFIRVTVNYTPPAGVTGTGAVAFAGPALAGAGTEDFSGTGAFTAVAPAFAGTGDVGEAGDPTGTGAVAFGAPALAGAGTEDFSGSGAFTAVKPSLAASGTETFVGTGGFTAVAPALAGSGSEAFTGSGGVIFPGPSFSGSDIQGVTGTGAVTFGAPSFVLPTRIRVIRRSMTLGRSEVDVPHPIIAWLGPTPEREFRVE